MKYRYNKDMKYLDEKTIIIYVVCIFLILICIIINQNIIVKNRYQIKSNKIPKEFNGFKILQLSDFHSKVFSKNNKILLKKIEEENPDIVVMTGDMISRKDKEYTNFLKLAKDVSLKYRVYYITGNHEEDLENENKQYILNELNKIGVEILYNQKTVITKNEEKINLYGLCFNSNQYKENNIIDEEIEKLIGKINNKEYNILLTHNSLYFEQFEKIGIDLVFSGHVHGGIIRIPFLGGLLSPETKFFPKYSKGKYIVNNSVLIASAGLGKSKIPRLFNFPDIPVITLYCEVGDR